MPASDFVGREDPLSLWRFAVKAKAVSHAILRERRAGANYEGEKR